MTLRTWVTAIGIGLRLGSQLTAEENGAGRVGFTAPAAPWVLTIPAQGVKVEQQKVKPDGSAGYFLLTNSETDVNVSFWIEPVGKCKDSPSCRDMVWEDNRPHIIEKPERFAKSEIGETSVFEYFLPTALGVPVRQQNMYAEFVVNGFWVDMHMSKVSYDPTQRHLFEKIVRSVRFEPKAQSK